MTTLENDVSRVTRGSYSVLYAGAHRARRIVVTLGMGDILVFREHGRRARFTVPIDSAFKYAVKCDTLRTLRERAEHKRAERHEKQLARERRQLFRR